MFWEERKVKARFYSHPLFAQHDRMLKRAYRFRNPYRINQVFLKKKGETDIHNYGETPLTSLCTIAEQCGLTPSDRVIELGCGRGRGVFFLSDVLGCQATGIEWIPEFVYLAQQISTEGVPQKGQIRWICQDMLEANLSEATCVYFCGTCFSDPFIKRLITLLSGLSSQVKIITVSYPLSDYSTLFRVVKQFSASFPWGQGDIYLNQKL